MPMRTARLSGGLQPRHGVDNAQPRANRPLGVVLVRLQVAEISEHPVAHIFGDKSVEPDDRLGDGAVISSEDVAEVFWIDARGKWR